MKKKIDTHSSDLDDTGQDGNDESVGSNHELAQSPMHVSSILELGATHSSDEESYDEHNDIAKVLFGSPESKKKSSSKQIKSSQDRDEKFSSYFDDSSSEEDENEDEYDVITLFQKFLQTSAIYKNAFYSHALGIQILRAPLVRKFYYEEKAKYLKYKGVMLDAQTIKNWIKEHIEKTIEEVCFDLSGDNADISKQLAKEFLDQYEEITSQLIDAIVLDKNLLFSYFNRETNPAELFKDVEDLLPTFYGNIRKFINEFDFTDIEFEYDDSDYEVDFVKLKECGLLERHIINYAIGNIEDCIDMFVCNRDTQRVLSNKKAKDQSKASINTLPESALKQAALVYLNSDSGSKSLDEVKKKITKSAIDIVLKEIAEHINNDQAFMLPEEIRDILVQHGFLALNAEYAQILVEINLENKNFVRSLFKNLKNTKKEFYRENGIERIILPDRHIFDLSNEDNFLAKFLATLNICNRSARRHLRNNDDDELERLIEEEYHRAWKFPQSERLVTDNHKFTTKGKRNDETSELGGYNKVNELIDKIIENLNKYKTSKNDVKDKDIAFWIRQILQGKKLDPLTLVDCDGEIVDIKHYSRLTKMVGFDLVKITYLLFGSEVVRNPASLIHQQMMLDLIIKGVLSWRDAIDSGITYKDERDGGEMPMSMKKAVPSARILHNKFFGHMPQGYMYDPSPTGASVRENELLQREHSITEKWFNDYIGVLGLNDEKKIEILVEQIVRWYGIHLLWYTRDRTDSLKELFTEESSFTRQEDRILIDQMANLSVANSAMSPPSRAPSLGPKESLFVKLSKKYSPEEADVQRAKHESLKEAEEKEEIGPRDILGFKLEENKGLGNCFYEAVAHQMQINNHQFIHTIPIGTDPHDSLRLAIQRANFRDRKWADDSTFDRFVTEFPDIILAVIDTRNPSAGFTLYYMDNENVITNAGDHDLVVPNGKITIRIAATGNHFMSIISHPHIENGAIHEPFQFLNNNLADEIVEQANSTSNQDPNIDLSFVGNIPFSFDDSTFSKVL